MQRLDRRSAGSKVAADADRLSDDLLAEEHAAFQRIEWLSVQALPAAEKAMRRRYRRGLLMRSSYAKQDQATFVRAAESVRFESRKVVKDLFDVAADLATESIVRELAYVEATMGRKYQGVSGRATGLAAGRRPLLRLEALDVWERRADEVLLRLADDVGEVTRASVTLVEPEEQFMARLFSTEMVRLPGHSGRGVWWRMHSGLARITREAEIRLVNEIRSLAISRMQEEVDAA